MGFVAPDGIAGDLGGGSLELIDIASDRLKQASTLPLGGLRLIDATGNKIEKAQPLIDEAVAQVPWLGQGAGRPFYAVGGSWRAIARLHMEQTNYPLHVMHGYSIPTREAIAFCEFLRKTKKLSGLAGFEEVAQGAARGAAVWCARPRAPAENAQPERGDLFRIRHSRGADLLACCRRTSAARIRCCRSAPSTRACARARSSTPGSCASGPTCCSSRPAPRRRPRSAACAMPPASSPTSAGASTRTTAASRASTLWPTPGSPASTTRAACSWRSPIFYRHAGASQEHADELSERLKALISKRAQKRARIVAAAIRTAHMLSIGVAGVIDETPLSYEGDKLVLTIPKVLRRPRR